MHAFTQPVPNRARVVRLDRTTEGGPESYARAGGLRVEYSSVCPNGRVATVYVDRLRRLRSELDLLLLQAKDVTESEVQLLGEECFSENLHRDALHLHARTRSVICQIEDLVHIVNRSLDRL